MKTLLTLLAGALLLAGCDQPSNAERDALDERDLRVRGGLEQAHLKNWDKAIAQFEAALAKNPALARPDLELALIYHQHKKDYIRAIYHYKSYLEKRPDTEKRVLIEGWIEQAKISLAGEIGRSIGDISQELVRLTRENNLLRKQLAELRGTPQPPAETQPAPPAPSAAAPVAAAVPAAAEPAKPAVPAAPAAAAPTASGPAKPAVQPAPPPAPVSAPPAVPSAATRPASRTYQVQPGDTLTRIAGAVYNDTSRWRIIYEANRDKMASENDLKAGQVIVIPDIESK